MGDAGSLVIGLLMGVLTIRTTFIADGAPRGWYPLFAPLVVLAVPLYDMIVVSIIRIRRGLSPFVGDRNHLSHRLVARGMSRRSAVACIWLMTAATSTAAVLLPHAPSALVSWCIFAQTLLVLLLVALLEWHRPPPAAITPARGEDPPQSPNGRLRA